MRNDVTPENFESWNAKMGKKYDPDAYHNHPNPIIRRIEAKRVKKILNFIAPTEAARVLEVGCGAGNVLNQVVGAELTGIDLSDGLLKKAKDRLGCRAKLVKADAAALPFDDGHFSVVYCTEVLEHVLDPVAVLKEMRRVMRKDGVCVVSIPNEALINTIKKVALNNPVGRKFLGEKDDTYHASKKMDDEWHLHSFDMKLLESVILGIFHIDETASIPNAIMPVRYVVKLLPAD